MGTYEQGVSTPSPADAGRPPFGPVAWAVLAGLFWAYLWLLILWFGLLVLGVIGHRQVGHAGASLTGWLFPDTSVWAVVSNLTAFAVACGVVAASVREWSLAEPTVPCLAWACLCSCYSQAWRC